MFGRFVMILIQSCVFWQIMSTKNCRKHFLSAVLDTMAFERLLGPCMDIMKRNTEEYEEQLVRVFGSKVAMSNDSHPVIMKIKFLMHYC